MDSILVTGNGPLKGQIPIAGAKNACLTLMPATLLSDEPLTLTNAPRLSDIKTMSALLASLGAEVKEVTLPHSKYAVAVYYLVAPSEASGNLARYDGVHYGHRAENFDDMIDMFATTRGEAFGDERAGGREVVDAAVADEAQPLGVVDQLLHERSIIRRDPTQAQAFGFKHQHGAPPPPEAEARHGCRSRPRR